MRRVINDFRDPALSLAAEEFLLTERTSGEYLMLWVSDPSIIIGKFQNPLAELSVIEAEAAGVPVFRRNSGGGTVYHDGGNLNYTVIADRGESSPEYGRFLAPIIDFLASVGVRAEIRDKSALFVGDRKISGNAEAVVGDRVMHHGTLLIDTDLAVLERLTSRRREKIISRSIGSNPAPVGNLRKLLGNMTMSDFASALADSLCDDTVYFTPDEEAAIESLAQEKYRTWEWNYGKSPAFSISLRGFELTARHGVIESVSEYGNALLGARLIPDEIRRRLNSIGVPSDRTDEIIRLIFD